MKTINNLTNEELEQVWNTNEELRGMVYDALYEDNMNAQIEEADYLLDAKNNKGYSVEDYYNSFYLKLRDGYKFLINCNLKNILDARLITQQEFEDASKLIDEYENITPFTYEDYHEVEEQALQKIDELAKEVLKRVEKRLHEYEDVTEEDAKLYFIENIDWFDGCYIKENEGYKLYKDIAYTKCYA